VNAGYKVLEKKNKLNLKVDNLIYLFLALFVLVAFFIFEIFFTGFFATTLFGFAFVLVSLGFAIVASIFCLSSHHEDFFDVAGFTILLFAINLPHTHYDNMIYIYIFVKMVL
jgi:hypothetical protein